MGSRFAAAATVETWTCQRATSSGSTATQPTRPPAGAGGHRVVPAAGQRRHQLRTPGAGAPARRGSRGDAGRPLRARRRTPARRVHRVRSVAMPTYREFPIGLAARGRLRRLMAEFAPDVVHLASPAWLGHQAGEAARSLGIPVVAVYQTDLIGFAERYPFPGAAGAMRTLTRWVHEPGRPHPGAEHAPAATSWPRSASTAYTCGAAASTPPCSAPSAAPTSCAQRARRRDALVGYVGRLAAEKELRCSRTLQDLPGTRLVLVGGGPEEQRLRSLLPGAPLPRRTPRRGPRPDRRLARRVRAHRPHRDVLPVGAGGARVRRTRRGAARRRPGRPRRARAAPASSTRPATATPCARRSGRLVADPACAGGHGQRRPSTASATARGRDQRPAGRPLPSRVADQQPLSDTA